MKIEFPKNDPAVKTLLTALASKNKQVRDNAVWSLAAWMGPALEQVILQEPVLSNLFTPYYVAEGSPTEIPIDKFRNWTDQREIVIWQQAIKGGLATNEVRMISDTVRVRPIKTETSVKWNSDNLKANGAEFIARVLLMLGQQILNDDNQDAMNLIAATLGNTPSQLFRAQTDGYFTLDDFNNLKTMAMENYLSWAGGTPAYTVNGYTDLYMSLRAMGDIRKMAYNPVNTDGPPIQGGGVMNGIPAPDELRSNIYSGAGDYGFFGTSIHPYAEFGIGNQFNDLFGAIVGTTPIAKFDSDEAGTPFDPEKDELILGIDRAVPSMYNVVETYEDDQNASQSLRLEVDDQYTGRSGDSGLYGGRQQMKIVLDDRAFVGLVKTKKS